MQTRRQEILTILKQRGEATVDELASILDLTPVTVRHHLDILRADGLVEAPAVRRRHGPGRPQYVYTLTIAAADHFPQAYDTLVNELLDKIRTRMGSETVRDLLVDIAENRVGEAPALDPDLPFGTRLDQLVAYMSDKGFIASWERKDGNWFVYASNCPYQNVATQHPELCDADHLILEKLVGAQLVCLQRITEGAHTCIYQIMPAGSD